MTDTKTVAVLVGSLRKGSLNRKMADALPSMAPEGLQFKRVEIGQLPLYDPDLDGDAPAPWREFRDALRGCDAVLFVSPEYNRSIPGALKNAIDVGSRPYGKSVFSGKPAAVMTLSPGAIGGFGANHHIRQCLVFLDMPVMQQPEAYIGGADKLFDDNGGIANPATREFLGKFLSTFQRWIAQTGKPG